MRSTKISQVFCVRFLFCILVGLSGATGAAVISVGTSPPLPIAPSIALPPPPPDTFVVPVQVSGALNLQLWQFDLTYDPAVVQVFPLLSPSGIDGIFPAEFTPGNGNTLSNILGGFPFFSGLVDDVAGSYPSLLNGVTGDGVLAYIVFELLPGQNIADANFAIENAVAEIGVPEPNTLALFAAALLILTFMPRLRRLRERT
jgi:hypothetical protein